MKEQVILLHGAIGSKEQLIPLQNELENKYTVHNFNFSGHGGTDFEIDFTIKKKMLIIIPFSSVEVGDSSFILSDNIFISIEAKATKK
jgi:hypothetical protein